MSAPTRVVIIGAGYAGVMAANRLAGSPELSGSVRVSVLNRRPEFVERIRLHELAAGTRESATVPMRSLLHADAELIEGTAVRIDPERRRVHLASGEPTLDYDVLLYAVGSTQPAESVPSGAYGLRDPEEARRLHARLSALDVGATVSVVGAGATGIEAATEIAEAYPRLRIRLISRGEIGANLSAAGQRTIATKLAALRIETLTHTTVQRCEDSALVTADGRTLDSVCTVWTGGFGVPELASLSGLPVDEFGRLLVDETLSCPRYPNIFGAGDAILAPRKVAGHLRMSCASALPLGAHAAQNIIALLTGKERAPLSIGYMIACISLGRTSGLIQTLHADDRPRRFILRGRLAGITKERVCGMTLSWLRGERRRSGSFGWPRGPRLTPTR
ncbi:NAD(P)/FAD-dependent oxidoreductase [Mycetocola sp. JXN-3]|uniref:NAD(P)/FAD-dependent oxidoreductase n=1 Tax=Mycetocola sp. JXN-3 TaxID=2116510 RepID=UPI00165D1733|nr:FAD-dependent oxidoreductase [Mycetocola sp. JXN-3]